MAVKIIVSGDILGECVNFALSMTDHGLDKACLQILVSISICHRLLYLNDFTFILGRGWQDKSAHLNIDGILTLHEVFSPRA